MWFDSFVGAADELVEWFAEFDRADGVVSEINLLEEGLVELASDVVGCVLVGAVAVAGQGDGVF